MAVLLAVLLAGQENPNIVLILADDFGHECVGANGGGSYPTPHLDRLFNTYHLSGAGPDWNERFCGSRSVALPTKMSGGAFQEKGPGWHRACFPWGP